MCIPHYPTSRTQPAGDAPKLRAEGWHYLCRSHLWHGSLATGIGALETISLGTGGFIGGKKLETEGIHMYSLG